MERLKREQIKIKVKKIIAEELELDPKTIKENTSIQDDLGADSLDAINIALALEDEFNIKIDHDSVEKFRKLKEIIKELTRILEQQKNACWQES